MKVMNRASLCFFACLARAVLLATSLFTSARAQDDGIPKYRAGDRVVVVRDAELRVPEGVVDHVWPGLVLKVSVVNDKWLWVSQGKPGWIDSADVVPLGPKAIDRINELLRDRPDSARLYSGLAAIHLELGDIDKAIEDCSIAIRLEPRSAEAYNNRGYMVTEKRDFDRAIKDFDYAIGLDPNHAAAYDNRGLVWSATEQYDKAIGDHTTAIRLDPKNSRYYNNRGNVYSATGDYTKAIEDFNEAIRLDPQEAVAYNNRGNARYFLKLYDRALADFAEAIRLDPMDPVAFNSRAVLRATCPDEKYRDGKQAIEDATKACELTEWKDSEAIETLAAAHAEAGDFAKAVEYQTKAMDLADQDDKSELQARLDLYKSNKPYRQEIN
jgi:tetratricopeptide (TPR) repeat protein